MIYNNPSLSALLVRHQQVSGYYHQRGWLETPDGRDFQPKASNVKFVKGLDAPYITGARKPRRWFAWLMGIFA